MLNQSYGSYKPKSLWEPAATEEPTVRCPCVESVWANTQHSNTPQGSTAIYVRTQLSSVWKGKPEDWIWLNWSQEPSKAMFDSLNAKERSSNTSSNFPFSTKYTEPSFMRERSRFRPAILGGLNFHINAWLFSSIVKTVIRVDKYEDSMVGTSSLWLQHISEITFV